MIKYIILLFTLTSLIGHSQITNFKIYDGINREEIIGATCFFPKLNKGSVSDMYGVASIKNIPIGKQFVRFSFIGYETIDTTITFPIKDSVFEIFLFPSELLLEGVTVSVTRSTRTIQNIPTRVEYIGGEELEEKAIMNSSNISMVLRESTGIQMQQTSVNSGNTSIRIQGLDGRYTQLLRDGFPLYGGFSSGLSIMQIPPLDLKSFEIIKGSASTLYGGGAIAGLVNMTSKKPEEEKEFDIMLTQTHALGSTGNVFYSQKKNKLGFTIYGSGNYQLPYDPENDGFSNLPKSKTFSLNPKIFYYPNKKTTMWLGINSTLDERIGGDIEVIKGNSDSLHTYFENNKSVRHSSQFSINHKINGKSQFNLKNSLAYFNRSLSIPDYQFKGNQFNTFSEINYQFRKKHLEFILGGNFYSNNFNEITDSLSRDQNDLSGGVFSNLLFDFSESLSLEAGVRVDKTKDYGIFALPKLSLLGKISKKLTARLGGGLGYKTPDIFIEEAERLNYRNILPINPTALIAEKSIGGNFDLNYKTALSKEVFLSINQLFYFTSLENSLLLENNGFGYYNFLNASDIVLSKGAETNIKLSYKDFKVLLNYAYINTTLNYLTNNPIKPLTAKHNIGSVFMYESEKWRLGYEIYYTGNQKLDDGSTTNDFITMGFMALRNLDWGSLYCNFENFTDQRQSKYGKIVVPPYSNPTFNQIYAPTDGIIISVGVIIKPFGNKEEEH